MEFVLEQLEHALTWVEYDDGREHQLEVHVHHGEVQHQLRVVRDQGEALAQHLHCFILKHVVQHFISLGGNTNTSQEKLVEYEIGHQRLVLMGELGDDSEHQGQEEGLAFHDALLLDRLV